MFSKWAGKTQLPSGATAYPQMDRRAIEEFVKGRSVLIHYYKAVSCPCTLENNGQPDIMCGSCKGFGWFHGDMETEEKYQRAMVHSRVSMDHDEKGGMIVTGTVSITFWPGVAPADGDIVKVCTDTDVINNEVHKLGSVFSNGISEEILRFKEVRCVERVWIWDNNDNKVYVLDEQYWQYNPTTHKIAFHASIPAGTKYAVRYQAAPEYILIGQTIKPLLRVAFDENLIEPMRSQQEIIYPYNVKAIRLDRAIRQRDREPDALPSDYQVPTTLPPWKG